MGEEEGGWGIIVVAFCKINFYYTFNGNSFKFQENLKR